MKRLTQTPFFRKLLSISSGAESSEQELQKLLDDFILETTIASDSDSDGKMKLRVLNYTKLRLQTLQENYEVKKKSACLFPQICQVGSPFYRI